MKNKNSKLEIRDIVITAVITMIVTTPIGFLFNYLCNDVPNRMTEFEKRATRVETQLETIMALKDEFKNIKQNVTKVQEEVDDLKPQTIGNITFPKNNATVNKDFKVSVKISNYKTNKYYFIANEIDGKFWPKFQIKQMNETYTAPSNEDGNPPNGQFKISLFEVDENEKDSIIQWLKGSDFSGIPIEGKLLDQIEVRKK